MVPTKRETKEIVAVMKNYEKSKAILWYLAAGIFSIVLAIGLLFLSGMNPFNARHWKAILNFIWEKKKLPDYWLYGLIGWFFITFMAVLLCPFSLASTAFGNSRWATAANYRRFKPTVKAKNGIVLGYANGRLLRSDAPLTTWVVAPAGTGKTAGIIIPSILSCPNDSLFINDPKGELFDLTSPARKELGEVYRIEWTAGADKSACWNPVDIGNLPKDSAERGDLIDQLTDILMKSPGNKGSDSDSFFSDSARTAFSSLLLYNIYEAERKGNNTSLGKVYNQISSLGADGSGSDFSDPVADKLKEFAVVAEVNQYPQRIVSGINQLVGNPSKTRGNIISTVLAKLEIFKNENVVSVTSKNNFNLSDLRGKNGRPITVYIVVPAFDQESFGKISGLLIESAVRLLTKIKPQNSGKSVRFILDEAGFLPPSKAVAMGPAITRGFRVSFLFAFQDYSQVTANWGEHALENLKTNTAYTIVLTQNNEKTAEAISKRIGTTTIKKTSSSKDSGKILGSKNVSTHEDGQPLIRPEDIMSLKIGTQIVLVQNNGTRPIFCKSAYYPKFSKFKKLMDLSKKT